MVEEGEVLLLVEEREEEREVLVLCSWMVVVAAAHRIVKTIYQGKPHPLTSERVISPVVAAAASPAFVGASTSRDWKKTHFVFVLKNHTVIRRCSRLSAAEKSAYLQKRDGWILKQRCLGGRKGKGIASDRKETTCKSGTSDTNQNCGGVFKPSRKAGLVRLLLVTCQGIENMIRAVGARDLAIWAFTVVLLLLTKKFLSLVTVSHADLYYAYYQPFAPFLAMLWGWGLNVLYFEKKGVRYDVCFDEKHRALLVPSAQILKIANVLTCLVTTSAALFLFYCSIGNIDAAAIQPPMMYMFCFALMLLPFHLFYRETREFFSSTLWRIVTPVRTVMWADFLLADVLTSLAKGISDVERAVCFMATGPVMAQDHTWCGDVSWLIPIGLAMPYFWRLCQCIRVYKDTGNKQQLLNALKYTTAFPVVFLSFAKYHVSHEAWVNIWKPLWLLAALVNSAYSYVWDVERDWEISFFSQMVRL